MRTQERILVYSLLAILVAANLTVVLGPLSRPAIADADASATTAALGPVESIELAGDKPVTVRNVEGRLAWGDSDHDRAYSVGYMFIGKALSQLMSTESFEEARAELQEELQEQQADLEKQLNDYRERLQEMDPESPEWQELFDESGEVYRQYVDFNREAGMRMDKLEGEQLEDAYAEMIAAVDVVAERTNIDVVYRFIPPGEPFGGMGRDQAMLSIRLRSVLVSPEGLDITIEVMDELGLDAE